MRNILLLIFYGIIIASIFYGIAKFNNYTREEKERSILTLTEDTTIVVSDTTKVLGPLKIQK